MTVRSFIEAVIRRLCGNQLRFHKSVCWGESKAGGFSARPHLRVNEEMECGIEMWGNHTKQRRTVGCSWAAETQRQTRETLIGGDKGHKSVCASYDQGFLNMAEIQHFSLFISFPLWKPIKYFAI